MDSNVTYFHLDDDAIKESMFTSELMDSIQLYEKSIELIGIVVNAEIKSNMLKFTITNNDSDVLECIIWDADVINRYKKLISPGNVIHLDGLFARPKNQKYSQSSCNYDMNVMTNTEVRLIKVKDSYVEENKPTEDIPTVSIKDAPKYDGLIQIEAYIKNVIQESASKNNIGCLSDSTEYKLEIRMATSCNMSEFGTGAHVKIIGKLRYNLAPPYLPYLWVLKKEHVTLASDKVLPILQILKGSKSLKRNGEACNIVNVSCKKEKKE